MAASLARPAPSSTAASWTSASPRWQMSSERSESSTAAGGGLGALEVAARREDVGAGGELWNLRGGGVGRGPRRGAVGVADRLLVPYLLSEDVGQECGGGRPLVGGPHRLEALEACAGRCLGALGSSGEQLEPPSLPHGAR